MTLNKVGLKYMKLNKRMVLMVLIIVIFTACGQSSRETAPDTIMEETVALAVCTQPSDLVDYVQQADPMQMRIEKRCAEITSFYFDLYMCADKTEPDSKWEKPTLSQGSIDAIENLLLSAGYDVMDTNGAYPSYLPASDRFYGFWDAVERRESAEQEVITILETGKLLYRLFTYGEVGAHFYCMVYDPDSVTEPYFEKHEIKDWELTEKGNFFYRIYPAGDKHYADFTLIRLTAPDTTLYDMTLRYILSINYLATNLFLIDWTESDFGELSFNDQFEYLYYLRYGKQFLYSSYAYIANRYSYEIPSAEFEEIVMPYFNIDLETFREFAQYNVEGDYYPWRPLETNDFVKLWYYTIEPEVTAYVVNSDGTIRLTVEVLSTDLKMDCLFAHEVTIRPLVNGQFQYVGNKVTFQTEYGLPYCEPRLNWRETR